MNVDPNRATFSEPTNYDLLLTLTRVEGKLDTVHTQGADHEARLRVLEKSSAETQDHEPRLKALEKARWPLPSLAMIISIGTLAVAYWQR